MTKKEENQRQAIKQLRALGIKPGVTIDCILRHVSQSGMMRHISLYYKKCDITRLAAIVLDYKIHDRDGGIKIGGCGMDMGFALIYNLGYALWPHGTRRPHGIRNRQPDTSGGYALKHNWL